MTTADTEARTALQELLDERQRYQGWLRALEQRRATTPAHVYERVHTDYTLRLDRVMQRLRERAEQLLATIEGMQSRLQTLRSREADRTDERHEYELRAAVGELSPDEWERRRADADRELNGIAEDRRQIENDLAELQRIVALTREAPAEENAESSAAPAAQGAPQGKQAAPTGSSDRGESRAGAAERASAPPSAATEPRASSAASTPDEGPPSTAGEHPLAGSGASPSIDDFIAEWPLRHMGSEGGSAAGSEGPSTAPPTASWHPPTQDTATGAASSSAPASTAPPPAASSPDRASSTQPEASHHHLGDGRRDMDKTLKCPECGAMNYATEWYCERCGGELASF